MASFRLYPGLVVSANVDIGDYIKKDYILQIMNARFEIAFVGIPGHYSYRQISGNITPIYNPTFEQIKQMKEGNV